MPRVEEQLRETVERAAPRLLTLAEPGVSRRPAPGKWSPKELLGHLIDSAANNHQRFVRAPAQPDLVFSGYDQEAWVAQQRYREAPWPELVALWRSYNLHLARVIAAVPDATRVAPRARHNLDAIAWRRVRAEEPTTLEYLMQDYVDHLRHHLEALLDGGTP